MSSNSIKNSLSPARIGAYEAVVGGSAGAVQTEKALNLYMWNAQVSSAFLVPLHLCEIVTRNAISDVLEIVYGPRWPWSVGFERSLPNPVYGFKPKDDLMSARRNQCLNQNPLRQKRYDDLEDIRTLRNRIAHHEPIVLRNLQHDFKIIKQLIAFRCECTSEWMQSNQMLLPLLTLQPR